VTTDAKGDVYFRKPSDSTANLSKMQADQPHPRALQWLAPTWRVLAFQKVKVLEKTYSR
jgi:hypothetical protein